MRSAKAALYPTALAVLRVGGLVTGWALYAQRHYRLKARPAISDEVMRGFDTPGPRMLTIGGGTAAAVLVAAEYRLLPPADGVPVAAWLAGAAGVVGAAVGLAYTVSSDSCEPMAVAVGERTARACYARTS